jgi:hypothetical protein
VINEQRQRTIDDPCRVSVRHHVTHQFLCPPQLCVGLAADGDAHQESITRKRRDDRAGLSFHYWRRYRQRPRRQCNSCLARDTPNLRRRIGSWRQACDLMLDVTFALMPRGVEQVSMIAQREMRPQQCDRRQRDRPVFNELKDDWKQPRRSRGLDAVIGGVLRQVQDANAVRKQRGRTFA